MRSEGPASSATWSAGRGGQGKGGLRLGSTAGEGCWERHSRPGVSLDCSWEQGKKPRVQKLRELSQRKGCYEGET